METEFYAKYRRQVAMLAQQARLTEDLKFQEEFDEVEKGSVELKEIQKEISKNLAKIKDLNSIYKSVDPLALCN